MKLTQKQTSLIMLISIFLLHMFDSIFLPNATFGAYKLVANIFIIILLVKFISITIGNLKLYGKRDITGSFLILIILVSMFKVVNF